MTYSPSNMKTFMLVMANDTKWLEREQDLPFTPYPGMTLSGLAVDEELKISAMSYDVELDAFKIRLAWLTMQPLTSSQMLALDVGWKLRK
jgi:hypothetical protein